jgi:hypothetical protein
MKKTVYFSAYVESYQGVDRAIEAATKKRDAFFQEKKNDIGEICQEEIKSLTWSQHGSATIIIQVSYYPKDK